MAIYRTADVCAGSDCARGPPRIRASNSAVGQESAAKAKAAGAYPLIGAITDEEFVTAALRRADGRSTPRARATPPPPKSTRPWWERSAAHSPDRAKPYLHTAGLWEWGSGTDITEDQPVNPPAIVG